MEDRRFVRWYLTLLGVTTIVPSAWRVLLGSTPRIAATITTSAAIHLTPAETLFRRATSGLLVLVGVGYLLHHVAGSGRLPRSPGVLLLPWAAMALSGVLTSDLDANSLVTFPVAAAAIVAARPDPTWLLGLLAKAGAGIAGISLLMWLALPGYAVEGVVKNGVPAPGTALVGVMSHPNVLGLAMALSLPAAAALPKRIYATVTGLCLVALYFSDSRTALAAGLIAASCAFLTRHKAQPLLAALLVTVIAASVFIVPATLRWGTLRSFSDRGGIWRYSVVYWHVSPWTGRGIHFYDRISQVSNYLPGGAFHGHNLLLHMLTTAGILGLATTLLALAVLTARAFRLALAGAGVALAVMLAWIIETALEVPTDFYTTDSIVLFTWLPLFALAAVRRTDQDALSSTCGTDCDVLDVTHVAGSAPV